MSTRDKAREKTVTRSFRIRESAFAALQEEARKRNVSVNTLLNLLLMSFAEYDRFLEEFRLVKLSLPTFRRILQASTEQAIMEAGRGAGSTLPESFLHAKHGGLSQEGLIEYFRLMAQYANIFEFNVTRHPGGTTVTLVHDLGQKGSAFLGEYARAALKVSGTKDEVHVDENSVTLELRKSTPLADE